MSTSSTPLIALDAVVIDTETTGLDARTARVLQIAAVPVRGGAAHVSEAFVSLVDPGVPIPKVVTAIHGIHDADVRGQPTFVSLAEKLNSLFEKRIVIGHAVGYDVAVLEREFALAGTPMPKLRTLDVRNLARLAAPSLASHTLDAVCQWLEVPIRARHSALGDAEATAAAFLALLPRLRAKGIRTVAEAEAATRKLAERELHGPSTTHADDTASLERIDSFPYRHRVGDIMSAPPLIADPNMKVRAAIQLLLAKGVSSVLVERDGINGIVTERDLLRAIDLGGEAALGAPIGPHVRTPLQTVRDDDFVYRAIGRIERLGIRHLGVVDAEGTLIGAVTTRNLLRHRATTAIALGDEIDRAPNAPALAAAWAQLPRMARSLLAEDVDPLTICSVVSSEICAMTRRAAELAEQRMADEGHGAPPVAYAVLVLGSAGRGESQLAADQDNAIVYGEGAEGSPADRWFERCATYMSDILDQSGVPNCKGGVMAKNRVWRKSVADWKVTIDGWLRRHTAKDLLSVDIFFDCLPVHGTRALGDEIWDYAYARAGSAREFQMLLTEMSRAHANAFTLFGGFRRDDAGRMDLKRYGLMPIFTTARVLSIRHGARTRSSGDRLRTVADRGAASAEAVEAIVAAQRTLLGCVIGQQLVDLDVGIPPSTRVAPARLKAAERDQLKSALKAVEMATDMVSDGRM